MLYVSEFQTESAKRILIIDGAQNSDANADANGMELHFIRYNNFGTYFCVFFLNNF